MSYELIVRSAGDFRSHFLRNGGRYKIVFVCNHFDGRKEDIDSEGVSRTAQYYSTEQIDEVRKVVELLGLELLVYTSEELFISDALAGCFEARGKSNYIVMPFAEGGRGSGRRALVPAFCNLLQIPFCGSPAHGSSIARHKYHANLVLSGIQVRVPRTWMYFGEGLWGGDLKPPAGAKVIMKPAYESNSVGIDDDSAFVVQADVSERLDAFVAKTKQNAVLQEFVSGYEIATPILQIEKTPLALPCVGFEVPRGKKMVGFNRTFRDECVDQSVSYYTVEEIASEYLAAFQGEAIRSFVALDMAIMGRIDGRIDEDGRAWIFDTNESPPPLSSTSYAASFQMLGLSYVDMVACWLGATCKKYRIFD